MATYKQTTDMWTRLHTTVLLSVTNMSVCEYLFHVYFSYLNSQDVFTALFPVSFLHSFGCSYYVFTHALWWTYITKTIGWFSNRTGTSVDDAKARGKDLTQLPVPNLPLCHWSSQLFNLRAPSSTEVPVLLLNQPITKTGLKFCTK